MDTDKEPPRTAGSRFDFAAWCTVADRMAPQFVDRTNVMTSLSHSSILFSDGLCICALCEMFDVDVLIEAGTGCGGSTEMFGRYFQPGSLRIVSIDLAYTALSTRVRQWLRLRDRYVFTTRWAQAVASERLAQFSHVQLKHGNAVRLMPAMVRRLTRSGLRVGLFIDGPKQSAQRDLAHRCLELSPLVRFAALDDIGPMFDHGARYERFLSSPYAAFATSEPRYFSRYARINGGRLPERMRDDPGHCGYGVGVLINHQARTRP